MKKEILLLALVVPLVGCTPPGKLLKVDVANDCFGGTGMGWSYTPVWYGDSYLAAFEITEVTYGSKWIFELKPQTSATDPAGVDYETVEVSIIPKDSGNDAWLRMEGETFADDPSFHVCVPQDDSEVFVGGNGFVEYDVVVDQVGKLDPRARVITN